MSIKSNKAKRSLSKKGFRTSETHHTYYAFYYNGIKTDCYTYFSQGSARDIDIEILALMKSQLKLNSIQQVRDLLSCPLKEADLIDVLIENKIIEPELT
jgi:hypothetical protein